MTPEDLEKAVKKLLFLKFKLTNIKLMHGCECDLEGEKPLEPFVTLIDGIVDDLDNIFKLLRLPADDMELPSLTDVLDNKDIEVKDLFELESVVRHLQTGEVNDDDTWGKS